MTKLAAFLMMGPLILIVGVIFKYYPPKKINPLYGYRTPRSMKNEDTWQLANTYSANLLIAAGLFTCIAQVIFWDTDIESFLIVGLACLLGGLGLSILLTEMRLRKTFDKDGNRINTQ